MYIFALRGDWKRLQSLKTFGLLALICTVTFVGRAQVNPQEQGKPTAVPSVAPKPVSPGNVKVPLIDQPLKLSDFANMEPREDLRSTLGVVRNFIQTTPNDGKPATEQTEVWLGHTKTRLYAVFLCHDENVHLVRTHLARRENILKDDNVTILIDPFLDRRHGILFQVNPSGVQADAAWSETNGPDYSYDQVWDSEARITTKGWMVLISIPFLSLRFPAANLNWGVIFERNLPRNSEVDYWPRVSANISGVLSQEGSLEGIQGVTGSHNIQLNPYALAQNEHELLSLDPNNPYFSSRSFEGTAGGEAKVVVKDAIVLDATFNPDFSDVESDQPQVTVNQRYPVYFPELRPFFLENANYFSTPIQLLHTRNIIKPEFGMRITGKVGRTNIGLLAIDDREPGQTVPIDDPLYQKRAGFFVGRVTEDVGKDSSIGLIYTDEEFGGGWNRIGGLDFTWRANPKWTIFGQAVESSTKGSRPDTQATVFPTGYSAGPASYLEVNRSAHAFNLDTTYKDFSTRFQSQVGFIQTTDFRNDQTHATYQWFPKHSEIQSFGLEANQNVAWDHQHNRVYHYSTFDPFVLLPRNIVIAPIGGQNSDTVGPQDGYPLTHNDNFTENFGGLVARGQPYSQFNFNFTGIRGGNVNYNPPTGAAPFLLKQDYIQLLFTLQPIRQLTADQTYLLDRDHDAHNNAFVYENQVFRTKLNYQFTRALSARVIVEYDSTLANPVETSLARTKQVQTQALLTWLPHPGTAIYVGWNNDLQNYDHTLCTRLGGTCDPTEPILPRAPGYLDDGRQFFVKVSYLFRF